MDSERHPKHLGISMHCMEARRTTWATSFPGDARDSRSVAVSVIRRVPRHPSVNPRSQWLVKSNHDLSVAQIIECGGQAWPSDLSKKGDENNWAVCVPCLLRVCRERRKRRNRGSGGSIRCVLRPTR